MIITKQKHFLFFFVHPSKYYLFRYTINYLKKTGHQVDIAIVKKDVLEDLVKQEGWEYVNLFPEGRRSKSTNSFSILFSTAINFFKTIYRLHKFTKGKKYDLFITDDCLVITGWYSKTFSIFFTDNELSTVPESALFLIASDVVLAPQCVNLGKFESKKAGFRGYKELAYLAPDYFIPNPEILNYFNPVKDPYSVIRLVAMTASHDMGIKGLSEDQLKKLIVLLKKYGKVFITSEISLNEQFAEYLINIEPQDISQVLYYADMFIGDSGTMTSEAAVLGTPAIMFHDFIGKLSVMSEKEEKYNLMHGFKTNQFADMLIKIEELLKMPYLKEKWRNRRNTMLEDMEDVNQFIITLLEKDVYNNN
jgi:uncharacterized protein